METKIESPIATLRESQEFKQLTASMRGVAILPDHPDYEAECRIYNAMIRRKPAMIMKCRDVADVIACVRIATGNDILTSIRSGGHNGGGLSMCDDGMVIDMSLMKGIRIDLASSTVRAEAGCLLGDLDHATQEFGMAVPAGILSTTGISGLTLGGGLGHLSRAYGLSIDSLLEVDIVLANGNYITANEKQHADLFWAVRGGGGNFGVVTSFLFQMHKAGVVYGGPMLWHLSEAREVMKYYRDFILKAPDNVYAYFAFLTVPPVPIFPAELHLKKMCGMVWCNLGEKPEATVEEFRRFKKPALDYVGPIPYSALQSLFDGLYPKGLQWYWKADFIRELKDEAIDIHIEHAKKLPTVHSTTHFYPINGSCHAKGNSDTAFAYRDANWAHVIVGVDPEELNKDKLMKWATDYWNAVHPFSAGGAYVNFMMDEATDRVKTAYRSNYDRLSKLKSKYDPDNFFRVNQNISPA